MPQLATIQDYVDTIYYAGTGNEAVALHNLCQAIYGQNKISITDQQEIFKFHGVDFIGAGSNRAVFGFGDDMVIKINFGGFNNIYELETFKRAKSRNNHYFLCPILANIEYHDKSVLVFPRVKASKDFNEYQDTGFRKHMLSIISCNTYDFHEFNVGMFHNGMVSIDYEQGIRGGFNDEEIRTCHADEWNTYKARYDDTVNNLKKELE